MSAQPSTVSWQDEQSGFELEEARGRELEREDRERAPSSVGSLHSPEESERVGATPFTQPDDQDDLRNSKTQPETAQPNSADVHNITAHIANALRGREDDGKREQIKQAELAGSEEQAPHGGFPLHPEYRDNLGPNARIWTIYMEEAKKYDTKMIDERNKSIDVLLIFAGLYSAILTAFLVPASASLSPPSNSSTDALLTEIFLLLQNGSAKAQPSPAAFIPMSSVRWMNGLWFASLSLALSSALISILAKGWLQAYEPVLLGTPRERVRTRQALFDALEVWHVGFIIDIMPMVLHASLVLFFAGLVLFVWELDHIVALVTLGILGTTILLYIVTVVIPLIWPSCPYRTPILPHLRSFIRQLSRFAKFCLHVVQGFFRLVLGSFLLVVGCFRWAKSVLSPRKPIDWDVPLGRTQSRPSGGWAVNHAKNIPAVYYESLAWLIRTSTDQVTLRALVHFFARLSLQDAEKSHILVKAGALDKIRQAYSVDEVWHRTTREDWGPAETICRAVVMLSLVEHVTSDFVFDHALACLRRLRRVSEDRSIQPTHIYVSACWLNHLSGVPVFSDEPTPAIWGRSLVLRVLNSVAWEGDISDLTILVECLGRYLSNRAPQLRISCESDPSPDEAWSAAAVKFLFTALTIHDLDDSTTNRTLRTTASYALSCLLDSSERTPGFFKRNQWSATDRLRAVCYKLLNPSTATLKWCRMHKLLSRVVRELCDAFTVASGFMENEDQNFQDSLHRLSQLFSERQIEIHELDSVDLGRVLAFWRKAASNLKSECPVESRREMLKHLMDMIHEMRHTPRCNGWNDASTALQELLHVQPNFDPVLVFHETSGFSTVLDTLKEGDFDNSDTRTIGAIEMLLYGLSQYVDLIQISSKLSEESTRAGDATEKAVANEERDTLRTQCIDAIFDSEVFVLICTHPRLSSAAHLASWVPLISGMRSLRPDDIRWREVLGHIAVALTLPDTKNKAKLEKFRSSGALSSSPVEEKVEKPVFEEEGQGEENQKEEMDQNGKVNKLNSGG